MYRCFVLAGRPDGGVLSHLAAVLFASVNTATFQDRFCFDVQSSSWFLPSNLGAGPGTDSLARMLEELASLDIQVWLNRINWVLAVSAKFVAHEKYIRIP